MTAMRYTNTLRFLVETKIAYLDESVVWMTWSKSVSRLGPGDDTENT